MQEKADQTFDAETTKPDPYVALLLYFSDGSRRGGIWTGKVWWSEGSAVYPLRWQRMQGSDSQNHIKGDGRQGRRIGPDII
jgi:hypothetical protein